MAPHKKTGRTSSGSEQESRTLAKRGAGTRGPGRSKSRAVEKPVEAVSSVLPPPEIEMASAAASTTVVNDDESDFSAGIFDPQDIPPPKTAQARPVPAPTPTQNAAEKSVMAVENEEIDRDEFEAVRAGSNEDDAESLIEPAPLEIDENDEDVPLMTVEDTDESLIQEARDDWHDEQTEESRPPTPSDAQESPSEQRRGRRGRRGRGGRGGRGGADADRDNSTAAVSRVREDHPSREFADDSEEVDTRPQRIGRGETADAPRTHEGHRSARGPSVEIPREEAPAEAREMLINVSDADECRIAMLRDGRLDELYIERASSTSNVGNIYKGRVTNVEPSIQAAFVDFGLPLHGFLHISDLHPKYFPESKGENELVGRKTPRRARPPIQTCLKRGQEVIVQVIKEGIGTKGPTLSTYISIPGRFLVMMPGMEQLGVSRKIEDEDQRRKVRDLLAQLDLPKDMGFIVRTAGIDRSPKDLQRDLSYLTRLWTKVAARIKSEPAPAELYKESDLVIRTIRDVYDSSIERILVDHEVVAERVQDFLAIAVPTSKDVVEHYKGAEPIFHRYGIESEIDKLYSKHVPLACGGSLVIEQTEALVAIDVNSGRFRISENAEETAYRVNQEAADEIARQLRLRDLGGLIIIDLIDMIQERHRRAIEYRLAEALKKHKERAKLLRISRFGILEMTRQRQRPSFSKSMFADCPRCGGGGRVKATESVALDVMRQVSLASHKEGVASIDVRVNTLVANEILNRKRHQITDLERTTGQTIRIHGDPAVGVEHVQLAAMDRRGREVPASQLVTSGRIPARPVPPAVATPRQTPVKEALADQGRRVGGGTRRRRRARGGRGGRGGNASRES